MDYWRSVLASGKAGETEGRLRRFDGVYRWFLFRATPSFDNDGRVVKWFGTNTDIEDRKRAECLLSGENLVLEMTAKGKSLESILEALCQVVEQTTRGCCCSVILIDPSGSKIQQAIAPSLPSSYNDRFAGTPVDREGGPCTRRKTQVIVSDVASDTQWDTFGWRTAALTHGLKACWSTTVLASNGLVLGAFAIYWREPRSPAEQDQKIIEHDSAPPATDAEKIVDKLRAGRDFISDNATILDWPAKKGGEYRVLREGRSEWTCPPGSPPGYTHDEPGCFDKVFFQWQKDGVALRAQHVERLGIGFMCMGAWAPNTSAKTADKEFRVGPYTMVASPAPDELQGFNRDGSNGMAYMTHLNGGDQLFLVIPIRQSDNP